jgi:cytidine diphosphoramidate kinase
MNINRQHTGHVIWITGLSGAGKTTISKELVSRLKKDGRKVILLDGDQLRAIFGSEARTPESFSREARKNLALRYSRLCKVLSDQGFDVVIATISLFNEVHEWNRKHITNYFEVFLRVPVEELKNRDPKGLYEKFENGVVSNVAGLDMQVDEPETPDVLIEWKKGETAEEYVTQILVTFLKKSKKKNA